MSIYGAQNPKSPRFDDTARQYDALLVLSFGGPEGPDDVIPFLEACFVLFPQQAGDHDLSVPFDLGDLEQLRQLIALHRDIVQRAAEGLVGVAIAAGHRGAHAGVHQLENRREHGFAALGELKGVGAEIARRRGRFGGSPGGAN